MGKKNTVCSASVARALHNQTTGSIMAQPQHPNPEPMVSTTMGGVAKPARWAWYPQLVGLVRNLWA